MPLSARNVISWTSLILSYKNSPYPHQALLAFARMQYSGTLPNRVTMVCALNACASHGRALDTGVWIHDYVKRSNWELDVILGTSLVDMYVKCGRIDLAVRAFMSMKERNVFTWNALICGLAINAGSGMKALSWFGRMEVEGVRPDGVTLIGVLSACSHSGFVEMGRKVFDRIARGEFGFSPGIKHYGCMVDLLARAGLLEEAVNMIKGMPFQQNVVIWGSLLGGCRAHGDLRLSEFAAKKLVELEPDNVAHYVVLSNLYAAMGRWGDVEEVRRVMKERGMRKDAGQSFAEPRDDEIDYCVEVAF